MGSDDLQRLVRWERSGGSWRVLSRRPGAVDIALLTCGGDQAMDTMLSTASDVHEYIGGRHAWDQP